VNTKRIAVIGAGVGGLVASLSLARQGFDVQVFERAATPGGKMRQILAGGAPVDAGPTVFTMRWVFDQIFKDAGTSLEAEFNITPLTCLARHAWSGDERLDLFSSIDQTVDAIGAFAGAKDAQGYRDFCTRSRKIYDTLEQPFMRSTQPTLVSLSLSRGVGGLGDMWRLSPFTTLWNALGQHFQDPRLRQLFGRYATYCGSSPYQCPATLMLVAHVEQQGVWTINGGMHRLAQVLRALAEKNGATFHFNAEVSEVETAAGRVSAVRLANGERFDVDAAIVNTDAAAVAYGLLGKSISNTVRRTPPSSRSLSAVTWTLNSKTSGFPLMRHNVFFSRDYHAEFDDIAKRKRLPSDPTIYICAQDRNDHNGDAELGPERMLILVNAPANGDQRRFTELEIAECEQTTFARLRACGLEIAPTYTSTLTTPVEFNQLFPATGGALYGQASHGWTASFNRPSGLTKIPGLYLAGGSVHPGPGVPMAALSGWLAAAALTADQTSGSRSNRVVMPGGMSTA
jgi:1-hydroxycarotenoid 3,4-desaturase